MEIINDAIERKTGHRCQNGCNLDIAGMRTDFPILTRKINGHDLIYFDSAATTQKPQSVIDAITEYYSLHNANVHRGIHTLSDEATTAYENTRRKIAAFINCDYEEVIYTRNATEALNTIAFSYGRKNVKPGDRIVITQMEHHANHVPWLVLAKEIGAELIYIPITSDGYLDLSHIHEIIDRRTRIVSVTHMSNVLGTINPIAEIAAMAHKVGAIMVVDGAQSVPHLPVNVQELDADFMAFSAHKMLGPTGLGVLYGKRELLQVMPPFEFGGEMIRKVTFEDVTWNDLPHKFEAGTPNIAGAYAFGAALDYLSALGMTNIRAHEIELTRHTLEKLAELDFIKVFGPTDANHRGGAVTFNDVDIHPHDLSTFLDTRGIAVRAGHHCAQPLHRLLGTVATTRASFYVYNTKSEVNIFIEALKESRRYFGYA